MMNTNEIPFKGLLFKLKNILNNSSMIVLMFAVSISHAQGADIPEIVNNSINKAVISVVVILIICGIAYVSRHRIQKRLNGGYEKIESSNEELSERFTDMGVDFNEPESIQWNLDANEGDVSQTQGTLSGEVDEFENFREYSFTVDDGSLMDVEVFSFSDRIDQLLLNGKHEEAKKTVEFAKVADESESDINLYLLKVYAAERDQESFQAVIEIIEDKISEYNQDAQLTITQLQSEMAA